MITWEVFMDIFALFRQGFSVRAIAMKLKIHRNTVKKYLREGQNIRYPSTRQQEGILSPYYQVIDDFLKDDDYRATWIYERIRQL
jgi:hypothetical protein